MRAWAFILYGLVAALNQIIMAVAGDWAPSNLVLVAVFYYILFRYFPRTRKQHQPSEQGVAPQSATRSESKSEGGDKPQPESEARLR